MSPVKKDKGGKVVIPVSNGHSGGVSTPVEVKR